MSSMSEWSLLTALHPWQQSTLTRHVAASNDSLIITNYSSPFSNFKMFLSLSKINKVQSICHISFVSWYHSATDMIQLIQRLEKEVWCWKCSGSLNRENWHSVFVDEIIKQINIDNRYVCRIYLILEMSQYVFQSTTHIQLLEGLRGSQVNISERSTNWPSPSSKSQSNHKFFFP